MRSRARCEKRAASGALRARPSHASIALSLAFAALSLGCFPVPVEIASAPHAVDPKALNGTWYVVASNFPMWIDGSKKNPTFVYTLLPDDGEPRQLDDIVWFQDKGGAPDTYLGVDEQDTGNPAHFTWRGKGGLFLFSSEWYLGGVARDGAWAVVYYTSTIASPDGVDVIARTRTLSPARLAEARALIASEPLLRDRGRGLVPVQRTDAR